MRNPLLAAVVATAIWHPYTPAHADDEVIEEIVTTGIRSSLMTSMNRKRSSTGVVDAITAEDIGKFPDQNLAEALQRTRAARVVLLNLLSATAETERYAPEDLLAVLGRYAPGLRVDVVLADPAAVAYDAVEAAAARDVDIVLVDTAGRLHTKVNLMEELLKLELE